MAYFSFAERIAAGEALPVFAGGHLKRDFTYIDDIVEGVVRLALSEPIAGQRQHEVYNIGNHQPVTVLEFNRLLSKHMDAQPQIDFLTMQPGDVPMTCADTQKLRDRVGFEPGTTLDTGLERFVAWFKTWKVAYARER